MSTSSWRQREVEKARLRKEQAARADEEARAKTIQKTETNFPSMGVSTAPSAALGTRFSSLAQEWATKEVVDKRMEEYRTAKAAQAAYEGAVHGFVVIPRRRPTTTHYEEEPEAEPEAEPTPTDEWTEVRHSKMRGRRELTNAEIERKMRQPDDIAEDYDRNDED